MSRKIFTTVLSIGILFITNTVYAATIYVDGGATGANNGTSLVDAFTNIQDAIDNATTVTGDTILIADGTYVITATIEVSKELTLQGTSQTGTIINASSATGPFGKFGIHSSKSNITFNDFTLTSPTGTQGRGFKIEGTSANTSGAAQDGTRSSNVSVNRVTVNGDGSTASRTGLDFNGINGVNITDVTSKDNGGNGMSFTDCNSVNITNVTTSGNKWGGVALYTKGQYYPGGISGVTVSNLDASEDNPFYNQNEGNFNSGNPFSTITLSAPQFTYTATNNLNADTSTYVWYNDSSSELATWINTATGDTAHSKVVEVSSGNTILVSGQTIQSRIDAAIAGDTIVVPAGSYTEDLTINKSVNIVGANQRINAVTGTRVAETILTGSILITSGNVTVDGFTITNPTWNGVSVKGVHVYGSGPTISDIQISNNIITNVNNANTKGAYGVMVQADVSNIIIDSNLISDITSAGWARGIEVTAGCKVTNVPVAVSITNNKITSIAVTTGTDVYDITIDWCDSPVGIANASEVKVEGNSFDNVKIKNLDNVHPLIITKNWWGNTSPDFSTATGTVSFDPWCTLSDCTVYYTAPAIAPVQQQGSIVIPASSYSYGTLNGSVTGGVNPNNVVIPSVGTTTGKVLGASIYKFNKNLGYGSSGNDVSELQKILIEKKYLVLKTGLPTGWFGPMTRAALMKWQADNSIPVTGYLGTLSRNSLNK